MNQNPKKKSENTVIALIAVTGLSVASQSGLVHQLFRVLDQNLVTPASAQEWRIEQPKVPRAEFNRQQFDLREMDIRSIQIEGDRAYLINTKGEREILPDGYYRYPDSVFLTVKDGHVIDKKVLGSGQNFHDDDGGWGEWNRECPECDGFGTPGQERAMPQRPNVRDRYNRIRQPQVPELKPPMPSPQPQPDPRPY
jgi:hypothetical protein